jgi:hypothetical protein
MTNNPFIKITDAMDDQEIILNLALISSVQLIPRPPQSSLKPFTEIKMSNGDRFCAKEHPLTLFKDFANDY